MIGTISVANTAAQGADVNNNNRKVVFKICAPFTNYISEISNAQVDNAKDIDVVMLMYDLIETTTIIQKHLEVYGNTIEMNHF